MGGCPLPAEACKRVGNTNTTYKVFHQRRLCDLLPRKKAFHWKPKVGGVCISSQMLNLAFQWTANLSVEIGFGVTAQSLLPAEGAFARKADYPIPQPVQRESQKSLAGSQSCRPSNSPVGTIFRVELRQSIGSCRPSNSPVGTMRPQNAPEGQVSCRPSNSPVGTILVALCSAHCRSCRPSNSPVGTIEAVEQIAVVWSCRPSNSPVGTIE